MGLFDTVEVTTHSDEYVMAECEEMSTMERLSFEKETTGLYLSGHPLQEYMYAYKEKGLVKLESFMDENYLGENDNKMVSFIAMVDSVKIRQTKSNNALANIKFEDMTGSVNAIAFASSYSPAASFLKTGAVVKVIGRLSVKEEEVDIICEKISPVSKHNTKKSSNPKNGLYLKIDSINSPKYSEIKRAVELYKGTTPLYIYETATQKKYLCNESMWVECEDSLLSRMQDLLGEENVVFVEK
jgi:DNA polymerase-3 subunit alpha